MPRKPGSPQRAHSIWPIFGASPTKLGTAGSIAPCTFETQEPKDGQPPGGCALNGRPVRHWKASCRLSQSLKQFRH